MSGSSRWTRIPLALNPSKSEEFHQGSAFLRHIPNCVELQAWTSALAGAAECAPPTRSSSCQGSPGSCHDRGRHASRGEQRGWPLTDKVQRHRQEPSSEERLQAGSEICRGWHAVVVLPLRCIPEHDGGEVGEARAAHLHVTHAVELACETWEPPWVECPRGAAPEERVHHVSEVVPMLGHPVLRVGPEPSEVHPVFGRHNHGLDDGLHPVPSAIRRLINEDARCTVVVEDAELWLHVDGALWPASKKQVSAFPDGVGLRVAFPELRGSWGCQSTTGNTAVLEV
eukprot:CAMPEP_0175643544 /NCGR_PEP_ID=MMETSP0097-20121207/5849_1 /TAXON_ID=311494 /ORGANISM="Alexandrium monilatum, Strain CCMP3105" /LENGTH=283 /DNA_ID=CAMNT_0016949391 /DNA_START=202 /DNA_END=1055 /DNA_ORIENTATION=-